MTLLLTILVSAVTIEAALILYIIILLRKGNRHERPE